MEEQECRGCRHWRPFVSQWGHCGCEMVRRHLDGEAPLVTRGSFACRFFSASAAGSRKVRDVDFGEQIQPRAIEAVD